MKFKDKILVKIYGSDYLEFYFIDSALSTFEDGKPRADLPNATGDVAWINSRVMKYLTDNGHLETFGNGYVITSSGKMFLNKGGARAEFIHHKLSGVSFVLSILATIISIISFFIAVNR